MTKKTILQADITKWVEEYQQLEVDLSTFEKIKEYQQKTGAKPLQVARLIMVSEHRGDNKQTLIGKDYDVLMNLAGAVRVSQAYAREHKNVTLPNGKPVKVRSNVLQVLEQGEEDNPDLEISIVDDPLNGPEMVDVESQAAAHRARLAIERLVTGTIYERMKIIALNNGNLYEVGEALKGEIDRMVKELNGRK